MATTSVVNGAAEAMPPKAPRKTDKRKPRRDPAAARYFLVAGNGNLELGEEKPNEQEALVAALKSGERFVIVTEWRPKVEPGRGGPVIRKEAAATK